MDPGAFERDQAGGGMPYDAVALGEVMLRLDP